MKKPKYELKHLYLKELLPKDFFELGDSAIDHLGEIISKIEPLEALGFILGLNYGFSLKLEFKQTLTTGLSGALAVRGLNSQNEVVGLSSLVVLTSFGLVSALPNDTIVKVSKYVEKQKTIVNNFLNDSSVSQEERIKRKKDFETYGFLG